MVGRKGTLGTVHFTNRNYWPHSTVLWVKDFRGNSPKFVYYFLKTLRLERLDAGAANPTLNRNHVHPLKIRIPKPVDQQKIADVLSSYDDLIENNRRRMALLEEAARQLYREWFVRLRFPGHESTPIRNGVPQGWEKHTLKELCSSISYGYTTSASKENTGAKFLRITDIVHEFIDWSAVPYCETPPSNSDQYLLSEGDVVVARTGATTGYAKRIGSNAPPSVFASYLIRLKPSEKVSDTLLGVFVESQSFKDYIWANIAGAAQPNANAKTIGRARLLVPTPPIQEIFHSQVKVMYSQRDNLLQQNALLAEARDHLLPRLMRGEIEV